MPRRRAASPTPEARREREVGSSTAPAARISLTGNWTGVPNCGGFGCYPYRFNLVDAGSTLSGIENGSGVVFAIAGTRTDTSVALTLTGGASITFGYTARIVSPTQMRGAFTGVVGDSLVLNKN